MNQHSTTNIGGRWVRLMARHPRGGYYYFRKPVAFLEEDEVPQAIAYLEARPRPSKWQRETLAYLREGGPEIGSAITPAYRANQEWARALREVPAQ